MGLWYFVWNTIENELKFELLIWLCIVFQAEFELYKKIFYWISREYINFQVIEF